MPQNIRIPEWKDKVYNILGIWDVNKYWEQPGPGANQLIASDQLIELFSSLLSSLATEMIEGVGEDEVPAEIGSTNILPYYKAGYNVAKSEIRSAQQAVLTKWGLGK